MTNKPNVIRLAAHRAAEAVDALSDAFYDYPVMTFSAGPDHAQYDKVLRQMVDVFVASRVLRGYPVLGITNERDEIVAVAALNPPHGLPFPPELEKRYEQLNGELGEAGTARLELLSETWKKHEVQTPHYHLGMIGVRQGHQGHGHARTLLEAIHEMSREDPDSAGVSLTTEDPKNVSFYERFGYQVIAHEQLPGIATWVFFRPNQ